MYNVGKGRSWFWIARNKLTVIGIANLEKYHILEAFFALVFITHMHMPKSSRNRPEWFPKRLDCNSRAIWYSNRNDSPNYKARIETPDLLGSHYLENPHHAAIYSGLPLNRSCTGRHLLIWCRSLAGEGPCGSPATTVINDANGELNECGLPTVKSAKIVMKPHCPWIPENKHRPTSATCGPIS